MELIAKPDWTFAVSPALLERGCVNIIGFELIKRAAGPRWQKARLSVCAQLEHLLQRTLGPADFFMEISDTAFLVSMPTATAEESQLCCLRVLHALHTQQLGRCDQSHIEIARALQFADGKLECAPLGETSLKGLALKSGAAFSDASCVGATVTSQNRDQVEVRARYVPLWDIQNEAITTYRCVGAEDTVIPGDRITENKLKSSVAELLIRLARAAQSLALHLKDGDRFLLTLPIPYELWCSPVTRMEVGALCRSLSSDLRPYMVFEISDLPDGVPQSRLSELVGSLRPFCRGVAVELPLRLPSYSAYQGCGLYAVSLSLSSGELQSMKRDLAKFRMIARSLSVKSVVYDIPGLDVVQAAREQGVTAISGACVGEPMPEPAPISRLRLSDMEAAQGRFSSSRKAAA